MGQIAGKHDFISRVNLKDLGTIPTPTAGEHILVSSDNSMNAEGQGNFDCYIVGDGTTAAPELELKPFNGKYINRNVNLSAVRTYPLQISNNAWATIALASNTFVRFYPLRAGARYVLTSTNPIQNNYYAIISNIGNVGDSVNYAVGGFNTLGRLATTTFDGIENAILYVYYDYRDGIPVLNEKFIDDTEDKNGYVTIDLSQKVFFGRRGAYDGAAIVAESTDANYGKMVTASGSFQHVCGSDFVYIENAKKIIVTCIARKTLSSKYGLCFYTNKADSDVISGITTANGDGSTSDFLTYEFDVPEGAKYLRTTWWYIGNRSKPTHPDLFKLEVIIKKEDVFLNPLWSVNLGSSLKGKKLSIIGDSISTFDGWLPSNRTEYDGTSYASWYPQYYNPESTSYAYEGNVSIVHDTWWYQLVKKTGMELLSNASWSASTVCGDSTSTTSAAAGCSDRRIADLSVDDVTPDIVVIWIGINDFATGNIYKPLGEWGAQSKALPEDSTNVSTFSEAYALMVYKVLRTYPKAKVFCCTLLQSGYSTKDPVGTGVWPTENTGGFTLDQYNDKIKEIAHALGAEVIDLAACGIHFWNFNLYTGDSLHPNYQGMRRVEHYIGNRLLECVSE